MNGSTRAVRSSCPRERSRRRRRWRARRAMSRFTRCASRRPLALDEYRAGAADHAATARASVAISALATKRTGWCALSTKMSSHEMWLATSSTLPRARASSPRTWALTFRMRRSRAAPALDELALSRRRSRTETRTSSCPRPPARARTCGRRGSTRRPANWCGAPRPLPPSPAARRRTSPDTSAQRSSRDDACFCAPRDAILMAPSTDASPPVRSQSHPCAMP